MAAGEGTLRVGSEDYPFGSESVLYLPAGQPHAIKFIAAEKTDKTDKADKPDKSVAVQFLSAARAAGPAAGASAPTKPAGKTRSPQTGSVP